MSSHEIFPVFPDTEIDGVSAALEFFAERDGAGLLDIVNLYLFGGAPDRFRYRGLDSLPEGGFSRILIAARGKCKPDGCHYDDFLSIHGLQS